MELKHVKETKVIVDYYDFEELVKKVYNQDYDFVADVEGNNDSTYTYTVRKGQFEGTLGKYYKADMDKFKKQGYYSRLAGKLLNDLADKNLVEEGNYLITVSW